MFCRSSSFSVSKILKPLRVESGLCDVWTQNHGPYEIQRYTEAKSHFRKFVVFWTWFLVLIITVIVTVNCFTFRWEMNKNTNIAFCVCCCVRYFHMKICHLLAGSQCRTTPLLRVLYVSNTSHYPHFGWSRT